MAIVEQIGVQASFGTAGGIFGGSVGEIKVQLGASATKTLGHFPTSTAAATGPAVLMVLCSANDWVEYSPDAGTTWRTLLPAGTSGLVLADGLGNVRLNNNGIADAGAVYTYITECYWIA